MADFINQYESAIRLGVFLGVFFLLAMWEISSPLRSLRESRKKRWFNNLLIIITGSLLLRFVFPTAAVGIALVVEENHWGILNYSQLPVTFHFILAVILLDLSVYFQHVMFHTLPLFWRFHCVHHTDHELDVTTGLRFHPIEILISMLVKFMTIAALGTPVLAVVTFEIILNVMSMFTHSNVQINKKFERILRWFIVTPHMHWSHHSVVENETNSNFGFNLSIWDRIFGTYLQKPAGGLENITLGLSQYNEDPKWQSFRWLLYMPFVAKIESYAINLRHK